MAASRASRTGLRRSLARTYGPIRSVWVLAATAARAGIGARVGPRVSGIENVEKPSSSARRAVAIQASAEGACAATTPKRNG